MVERFGGMWSTGEGNGKPLQYSCLENPMNSLNRKNDRILKEKLPRSISWWWTGRPGVLWFMGSQRVGYDWATDLIWSDLCMKCSLDISNFLEEISSLSHSIIFLYFFALITEEGSDLSLLLFGTLQSSFSVLSFCLFILFMGFPRQEYWSGLPFPSPVDHILSELSTITLLSWVALHSMA